MNKIEKINTREFLLTKLMKAYGYWFACVVLSGLFKFVKIVVVYGKQFCNIKVYETLFKIDLMVSILALLYISIIVALLINNDKKRVGRRCLKLATDKSQKERLLGLIPSGDKDLIVFVKKELEKESD